MFRQPLCISNVEQHAKIMFKRSSKSSASPTSVSMISHVDSTMETGGARQLSYATVDYCCRLLSKQVACGL